MIFQYDSVSQMNHIRGAMNACISLTQLENDDFPETTKAAYQYNRPVASKFKRKFIKHIQSHEDTVVDSLQDLEELEPLLTVSQQCDPFQRDKFNVSDIKVAQFKKALKPFLHEETNINGELMKYKGLLPMLTLDPDPPRDQIAYYSASQKLDLAKRRDPAGWWKQHQQMFPILSGRHSKITFCCSINSWS